MYSSLGTKFQILVHVQITTKFQKKICTYSEFVMNLCSLVTGLCFSEFHSIVACLIGSIRFIWWKFFRASHKTPHPSNFLFARGLGTSRPASCHVTRAQPTLPTPHHKGGRVVSREGPNALGSPCKRVFIDVGKMMH